MRAKKEYLARMCFQSLGQPRNVPCLHHIERFAVVLMAIKIRPPRHQPFIRIAAAAFTLAEAFVDLNGSPMRLRARTDGVQAALIGAAKAAVQLYIGQRLCQKLAVGHTLGSQRTGTISQKPCIGCAWRTKYTVVIALPYFNNSARRFA